MSDKTEVKVIAFTYVLLALLMLLFGISIFACELTDPPGYNSTIVNIGIGSGFVLLALTFTLTSFDLNRENRRGWILAVIFGILLGTSVSSVLISIVFLYYLWVTRKNFGITYNQSLYNPPVETTFKTRKYGAIFISVFALMPGLAQMLMGRVGTGLKLYATYLLSALLAMGSLLVSGIMIGNNNEWIGAISFVGFVFITILVYMYGIVDAIRGNVLYFKGERQ